MSLTVGHQGYGALWTDFERYYMLIRITCRSKWTNQRKWYGSQGVKSSFAEFPKVSYMDKREKPGILYGSI